MEDLHSRERAVRFTNELSLKSENQAKLRTEARRDKCQEFPLTICTGKKARKKRFSKLLIGHRSAMLLLCSQAYSFSLDPIFTRSVL